MAENDNDESSVSFEDAASLGFRIVEMAERLRRMNNILPGSQAKWAFEMDDVRFEVLLTVSPQDDDG